MEAFKDGVLLDEANVELLWAQQRRTSKAKNSIPPVTSGDEDAYFRCLATFEDCALKRYTSSFPGSACSLTQDPEFHPQRTTSETLHTLCKVLGLVWNPFARRWLFPTEALLAQGQLDG